METQNLIIDNISDLILSFSQIKGENDNFLDNFTFVKTNQFKKMMTHGKTIISGRKGSGKSSFLKGYKLFYNDIYFSSPEYIFDKFPFSEISKHYKNKDFSNAEILNTIKYSWFNSFKIYALYESMKYIIDNHSNLDNINTNDIELIKKIYSLMSPDIFNDLFTLVKRINLYQKLERLEGVIGFNLLAELIISFMYMKDSKEQKYTEEDINECILIVSNISINNKLKILISSDRFDDFFDKYRQEDENLLNLLLEGLLLSIKDLKNDLTFSWIHLFITIPQDAYLNLFLRESLEFNTSYIIRADWTPQELFKFVNYRFAKVLNIEDKNEALKIWYKIFPKYINNTILNTQEDSFMYFLRHTFWNPRHLGFYLHKLFENINENINLVKELSLTTYLETYTPDIIAMASDKLVSSEFFAEYTIDHSSLTNILSKMRNRTPMYTMVNYSEMKNILSNIEIRGENKLPGQLKVLFQMGLLGYRRFLSDHSRTVIGKVKQQNKYVCYCYVFNGNSDAQLAPIPQDATIVIHPLFFDYLDCVHTDEIVKYKNVIGYLTWESFRESSEDVRKGIFEKI